MSYQYSDWSVPEPLPDAERRISVMGRLFIAVFFIVVLEGALRKWVSADLTVPLVLLRDGISIYGIYWAISHGKLTRNQTATQAMCIWTALVVVWGMLQVMANESSILIFVVGLRFWLLYLWFSYAAALALTKYDFNWIIKIILKFILYMTPLVVFQFYSSPGHFINQQVDGDEDKVFRLTADVVRTTGTFSFTAGQTTLLAMLGPLVFCTLTATQKLFSKSWLPLTIFLSYVIAVMLSGSRAALTTFIIQFVIYIFIEIIYSKSKNKFKLILIILISLIILIIMPFVFTSAVDATTERVIDANDGEVLSNRIFIIFFGDPELYTNFNFMGYGIGAGTNFIGTLSNTNFALGETETSRTMLEGGVFGFIFLIVKALTISVGVNKSIYLVKSNGNSMPLLMWFTIALALFTWSIIGQLTVNALGYMLLGLGIAAIRIHENNKGLE